MKDEAYELANYGANIMMLEEDKSIELSQKWGLKIFKSIN
jgi:hypothetical protein